MVKEEVVYFAHPVVHYNTSIEYDCIDFIYQSFKPTMMEEDDEYTLHVMNPNQPWLQNLYNNRKKSNHPDPFEIFQEIARSCDIIVGTTFLDGILGAGVANEMEEGLKNRKKVYLIMFDNGTKLFLPYMGSGIYTVLSIEETRKRNKEGIL